MGASIEEKYVDLPENLCYFAMKTCVHLTYSNVLPNLLVVFSSFVILIDLKNDVKVVC